MVGSKRRVSDTIGFLWDPAPAGRGRPVSEADDVEHLRLDSPAIAQNCPSAGPDVSCQVPPPTERLKILEGLFGHANDVFVRNLTTIDGHYGF